MLQMKISQARKITEELCFNLEESALPVYPDCWGDFLYTSCFKFISFCWRGRGFLWLQVIDEANESLKWYNMTDFIRLVELEAWTKNPWSFHGCFGKTGRWVLVSQLILSGLNSSLLKCMTFTCWVLTRQRLHGRSSELSWQDVQTMSERFGIPLTTRV